MRLRHARTPSASGFTLVELLIYVGILTLALVSIVVLLSSATKIVTRVKEVKEVRSSALMVLDRLDREVKKATSIVVAESVLGATPGSLTLLSVDEGGNPREVMFGLNEDDDIAIYYDGTLRGALTSEEVVVNEIEFYRVDNVLSESVIARFTLSHEGAPTKTETFYLTAVLRGSY
ncbi:MAG: type II secretion system protein [Candidatus Paceibacterota bacterium]